ncbi:MAG: PEP-CTERM sorting domain-containing protein [Akkermansiaceae bacterium]|nr:PEP-CTERM sorting domain-containing protein [Akkermansiaceae bacterium]
MKYRTLLCIAGSLLAVTASSSAAGFIEDFSGLNNGDALVPTGTSGYNGWTQTEANWVDPDFPADSYPIAWGQTVVADKGVAVGGWFSTPEEDSFSIQHSVGIPLIGGSVGMTFTVGRDPSIDSIQNTFEIGAFNGGGSNLFSFGLEPTGDPDAWNMYYTTGTGGNINLSTTNAVALNQVTDMDLTFSQNGFDTDFALALATLSGTLNYNGTLTGLVGEDLDSVRISMLKVPGTDPVTDPFDAYGTNFVAVSNLVVIPEPGSLMLLGLTVGASLLGRRRRA